MSSDPRPTSACMFCGGRLRLRDHGVFHPFKLDHGPFDIYVCTDCGSCQTDPLPSSDSLASLYGSFQDGLPKQLRTDRADDPQLALYRLSVKRILLLSGRCAGDEITWLDVGGGGGEFSALMAAAFPRSRGVAIDLHSCPTSLACVSAVDWRQMDINQEEFAASLPQADLVASISVWEHVLRPDLFVANLLRLVRPGGMLYLLFPDNNSWASRLLGRRWPYFSPGEHLALPTSVGAVRCLQREWRSFHEDGEQVSIHVRPLMLPYTLRYVMRRLGADAAGRLLPAGWSLPIPAGALEAAVIRPAAMATGGA